MLSNSKKTCTLRSIGSFKPMAISNSLWAFAKMGKVAPDILLNAIKEDSIGSFKPMAISNSLWAYATMGKAAPDVLLNAITEDNIKGFNSQNISNSLWAFAVMRKSLPLFLKDIPKLQYTPEDYHQLYLVSKFNNINWEIDLTPYREREGNISKSEISILNYIQKKIGDIPIDRQKFIETTASYVDGYIEYQGKKIIIQVDGPHHYYMGKLCSADIFMGFLLEREGYKVIRIKGEASGQEKDRMIQDLLNFIKN
jgi:very-short-patch-repair endonuclease